MMGHVAEDGRRSVAQQGLVFHAPDQVVARLAVARVGREVIHQNVRIEEHRLAIEEVG
jgi:hypothetical protein